MHVQQKSKQSITVCVFRLQSLIDKTNESFSKDKLQAPKCKAKKGNVDMKNLFMKHFLSQFTSREMTGPRGHPSYKHYAVGAVFTFT